MKWYSMISLSFPASWAAIVIASLLLFLYLFVQNEKEAANLWSNAFFSFIIIWKLTVILFYFKMTMKNPLTIVYFNGGLKGYWIAFVISLLYFAYKMTRSNKIGRNLIGEAWIFLIMAYEFTFFILNEESMLLSVSQFIVHLLFLVSIKLKFKQKESMIQAIVLFTAFQGFIYSIKGQLLSVPMLSYVVASLIIVVFIQRRANE